MAIVSVRGGEQLAERMNLSVRARACVYICVCTCDAKYRSVLNELYRRILTFTNWVDRLRKAGYAAMVE